MPQNVASDQGLHCLQIHVVFRFIAGGGGGGGGGGVEGGRFQSK